MKGTLLLGRSVTADTLAPQPGIYLADHRSSGPFLTLLRYRELLRQLVIRDIKLRYKRSVLGFAWTVLNPLFAMAIFTMVFSRAFGGGRHYPLYVVAALLGWSLFSVGSTRGLESVVLNGPIIRKVSFPRRFSRWRGSLRRSSTFSSRWSRQMGHERAAAP